MTPSSSSSMKFSTTKKGKCPRASTWCRSARPTSTPGSDITLITYSRSLKTTLAAADKLAEENIGAEVIDLRTIRPLDLDTLLSSVTKTHRAVIVEEDWPYCGLGAGIADRITQRIFDELDAPIRRVASKDAPIPYNKALEASMLPSAIREG